MSKTNVFNFETFLIYHFGTINKEEVIKKSREKLLGRDINYCDAEKREAWRREVERLLESLKNDATISDTNKNSLTNFLCAGEYMEMIAEKRCWDEITYSFFCEDFPDDCVYGICDNMLSYSAYGIEFIENVFDDNIPDTIKKRYEAAKKEREDQILRGKKISAEKTGAYSFESFMINRFGTINKEEIIKRSRRELLVKYIDYCDIEKKELWRREVERLLESIKEDSTLSETNGKCLTYYLFAGEYMKMMAEKRSWDEIIYSFFNENFSDNYVWGICDNMLSYSTYGIEFIENVFGNKIPKSIENTYAAKRTERDERIEEENKLLEENRKKRLFKYRFEIDGESKYGSTSFPRGWYKKMDDIDLDEIKEEVGTLRKLFFAKKKVYDELAQAELETGPKGENYDNKISMIGAIRRKMNKIMKKIKEYPVPYAIYLKTLDPTINPIDEWHFEYFVGRHIRIYHAIPRFEENGKIDLVIGVKNEVEAIVDEVYGREVVEAIDTYMNDNPIEQDFRKFLIMKRNEILQAHPEVENWYLGISYFGSKKMLGNYDPKQIPILESYASIHKHDSIEYIKNDIFGDYTYRIHDDYLNGKPDYEHVYSSICFAALRPFLGEGENVLLDQEIKKCRLFTKSSDRSKRIVFMRGIKKKEE